MYNRILYQRFTKICQILSFGKNQVKKTLGVVKTYRHLTNLLDSLDIS